ncbi:hypothetical protein I3843_08G109900 [Carya illinoinensis]|nr:hypothetical protein I3843_08G109900 [Carya illinoinensis]
MRPLNNLLGFFQCDLANKVMHLMRCGFLSLLLRCRCILSNSSSHVITRSRAPRLPVYTEARLHRGKPGFWCRD